MPYLRNFLLYGFDLTTDIGINCYSGQISQSDTYISHHVKNLQLGNDENNVNI